MWIHVNIGTKLLAASTSYTCCNIIADVSGGYSSSILDAMRCALHMSKAVWFSKDEKAQYVPLSLPEVLYMATMGGASGKTLLHIRC